MNDPEIPTEAPAKSGGFHLPVLPAGWEYDVRISGPEGQSVAVGRHRGNDSTVVSVDTGLGRGSQEKTFEADSLADGVKQGVALVRTLRDLSEHEKKSRAAREALLAQIGRPSPRGEDGTLATPDSLDIAADAAEPGA